MSVGITFPDGSLGPITGFFPLLFKCPASLSIINLCKIGEEERNIWLNLMNINYFYLVKGGPASKENP